ncbi:MAG: diaminopimelate epimerase [Lachnospiraceae bacterium]|nr:diaminopimelate epimerase [Lachnospiraceae bacterium]
MKFWKMNGAGNDFIVINNIEEQIPVEKLPYIAKTLCERHLSIGADGFMVVERPSEGVQADYRMLFYNSDGSIGEMCGNGARCICRYGYENGLAATEEPVIETTAGLVSGRCINKQLYRIRLNDPSVIELDKKLILDDKFDFWTHTAYGDLIAESDVEEFVVECSYLVLGDPGIPHLVVEYKGNIAALCKSEHLETADENILRELGRALRWNSALPKGANVNFIEVSGDNKIYERTYERGVEDFTYACGTGTGCAGIVLTLLGKASGSDIHFTVTGGELIIDVEEIDESEDGSISVHGLFLTGPTNVVAKGEVTDENLIL